MQQLKNVEKLRVYILKKNNKKRMRSFRDHNQSELLQYLGRIISKRKIVRHGTWFMNSRWLVKRENLQLAIIVLIN